MSEKTPLTDPDPRETETKPFKFKQVDTSKEALSDFVTVGTRAFGSQWIFFAIVGTIIALSLLNLVAFRGKLDMLLFGATILIGGFVFLKQFLSR